MPKFASSVVAAATIWLIVCWSVLRSELRRSFRRLSSLSVCSFRSFARLARFAAAGLKGGSPATLLSFLFIIFIAPGSPSAARAKVDGNHISGLLKGLSGSNPLKPLSLALARLTAGSNSDHPEKVFA